LISHCSIASRIAVASSGASTIPTKLISFPYPANMPAMELFVLEYASPCSRGIRMRDNGFQFHG
jgi:hypothetical protein